MNIERRVQPPYRAKRAIDGKPFTTVAPSILPLNLQAVWSKPYFVNYGGSGACNDGTEPISQHSDAKISGTLLAILENDNDKRSQRPSPPCDKNPILSVDDIYVKSKPEITGANTPRIRNVDPNMDPKKLRRIMSNRVSAQKSRLKKLQYVTDMERKVKAFEAQIALLHPQVALYRNQQEVLKTEQKRLKQRMKTYTNNSILRDVEIEENKAEVTRLRQLQLTQQQLQQQQMAAQIRMPILESEWEEMALYVDSNHGQYGGNNIEETNRLKLLELKRLAMLCGDEKAETNGHNLFNKKQPQMPGEVLMQLGEMPHQSGPPQKLENMEANPGLGLGGIEQLFNLNASHN